MPQPYEGAAAQPYSFAGRSSLSALKRELASDARDPDLFPLGNALNGEDRFGVVTPEMFDPMLAAPMFNTDASYPGGGAYYGFNSYAFYQAIGADAKVSAALTQRHLTTIEREWVVEPGGTDDIDEKAADSFREILEGAIAPVATSAQSNTNQNMSLYSACDFDTLQLDILDAVLIGFSALEVIYDRDGSLVYPAKYKFKHQHRFNMYLGPNGWEPRLLTREHMTYGEALPQRKFLIYRHRERYGPFGRGLAYELGSLIFDKRDTLKFYMVHGQRHAGPTVFIEVPPNASDIIIERAREAAENIGQEAANTIPQGCKVVVVEGKVGNSSIYNSQLQYFDGAIAQLILGQTGTIDQSGDGGSRAQDEVADVQTLRRSREDSKLTCNFLRNTLGLWLTQQNFPGAKVPKLRRLYPELDESEDELQKAKRDEVIVGFTGKELDETYLKERHQVQFSGRPSASRAAQQVVAVAAESVDDDDEPEGAPADLAEGELERNPAESGWSSRSLAETSTALIAMKNAIANAVAAAESRAELETIFQVLLSDQVHWEEIAQPLAKALLVGWAIGVIDVEGSIDSPDADAPVELAEGIDPVMGFDAAIAALKVKVPVPTARWDELAGEAQSWAFTVAGILQADVLADIQAEVGRALEGDRTFGEFKQQFEEIYLNTGASPLEPWRVRLIHNQNISNAYQAGRYERSSDPEFMETAPYRRYKHGGSDEPRPHHVALDGFIARADDPIWESIFPPNGFNCSCRVFSLTQGRMDRDGLSLSDPLPSIEGKPAVNVPGVLNPVKATDAGFDGAPSILSTRAKALESAKDRLPPALWSILEELLDALSNSAESQSKGAVS